MYNIKAVDFSLYLKFDEKKNVITFVEDGTKATNFKTKKEATEFISKREKLTNVEIVKMVEVK